MLKTFHKEIKESSGMNEYLTPDSAVVPILPFCKGKRVWCPFDLPDSSFVRVLMAQGIPVIHSHITEQKDFFTWHPPLDSFDCICSNPPFSCRDATFERLFTLGKPFMMLVNSSGLFDNRKRFHLFKKNGIELLILPGRVAFTRQSDGKRQSPMFQSWYVCHDMLPERLVFARKEDA